MNSERGMNGVASHITIELTKERYIKMVSIPSHDGSPLLGQAEVLRFDGFKVIARSSTQLLADEELPHFQIRNRREWSQNLPNDNAEKRKTGA